jgi:hypothetical protein
MRIRWFAAVLALLITAGCDVTSTTEGAPPQGGAAGEKMKPLVEQFKEARDRATSDFERQALDRAVKSGKIDAADYEEAFSRYRQCARDAGQQETYTKLANGIYRVNPPANLGDKVDAYAATMRDCAGKAGLMSLEALLRTQVDNPELLADPRLITVRCLVKAGLVPADYTVDKLVAFLRSDLDQKTDFDPMTAEAQSCLTAGGIAVQLDPKGGN